MRFIRERHRDTLFSEDGSTVDEQVARMLGGRKVAVAESETGGLMSARLTERPGSSAYFAGGVVAYSNEAKVRLVGVEAALIERSADTDATTVRSALREEGVKLGAEDRVTPGLGAKVSDGLAINVFRPLPVAVDFDGDLRSVDTTWRKPAQLVQQLHLDPKRISIVTAPSGDFRVNSSLIS